MAATACASVSGASGLAPDGEARSVAARVASDKRTGASPGRMTVIPVASLMVIVGRIRGLYQQIAKTR